LIKRSFEYYFPVYT